MLIHSAKYRIAACSQPVLYSLAEKILLYFGNSCLLLSERTRKNDLYEASKLMFAVHLYIWIVIGIRNTCLSWCLKKRDSNNDDSVMRTASCEGQDLLRPRDNKTKTSNCSADESQWFGYYGEKLNIFVGATAEDADIMATPTCLLLNIVAIQPVIVVKKYNRITSDFLFRGCQMNEFWTWVHDLVRVTLI